jgi:hypothetical protein
VKTVAAGANSCLSGLSGAIVKQVDIVLADGACLISLIAEILDADTFHHSKDLVLDDVLPEGLNETFGEKYSCRSWMTSVKHINHSLVAWIKGAGEEQEHKRLIVVGFER